MNNEKLQKQKINATAYDIVISYKQNYTDNIHDYVYGLHFSNHSYLYTQ